MHLEEEEFFQVTTELCKETVTGLLRGLQISDPDVATEEEKHAFMTGMIIVVGDLSKYISECMPKHMGQAVVDLVTTVIKTNHEERFGPSVGEEDAKAEEEEKAAKPEEEAPTPSES